MRSYLDLIGIAKTYGSTAALADIQLGVERGEFLALLGPSGCGKSTLLRIIAGLLEPSSGDVVLDGEEITAAPPWKRDIGLVFQNYALFPHLNVRQNVSFGLDMRRIERGAAARAVSEALDLVGLGELGDRRPAELSGGQQQRVAIARAIAIKPRLLLLDEPLSNLDAVLRNKVRVELRELHQRTGLTTIMVTHDQAEALSLADRVAVMSGGRVLQHDTPGAIYSSPSTPFVASFVGSPAASLLKVMQVGGGRLALGNGAVWDPPHAVTQLCTSQPIDRPMQLMLRPERLTLTERAAAHALPCTITAVEFLGADFLVHLSVGDQMIQARVAGYPGAIGTELGVLFTEDDPIAFDSGDGSRVGLQL